MEKRTIFQKINNALSGQRKTTVSQQFNVNRGELLRTTSKEEYATKKLQSQQDKHLRQMWQKVEGETYQRAMHSEITRMGSYSDFENMEFFPEIATALDIYRDESSTINKDGDILNISSSSTRIKNELKKLFYDNLKIHTNLPAWIRSTVKYGDNFLFLNIRENLGVIDCRQLPNFEIERRDGDFLSYLSDDKNQTKFIWRGHNLEFTNWQVAHFRLLGDDRKIPYGTSLLEKCRRIWKQLLLAEDSMLVYRVTRAPERRVFKIYVGNLDDEDIPGYVNDIANRFKRTPLVDPQTGQIDLRYNTAANDQDFFIPVRDENAPNPIDTLSGAQNLGDIEDIEYLQKKLCIALRVPRTFLGFDDAVGEGKNLALMDVRFARSVNGIQQAIIQELNKIAIIHLHMLGFDDELGNFSLSLNNPSTQAKMLEIEQEQVKVSLFKDLVSDAGDGFKVKSRTRALKEVYGWSEEEIRKDMLEQRMEKAAATELENTSKVIKYTGIFDDVDKIYGDIEVAKKGFADSGDGGDSGGGSGGSGGLGGGFGGGGLDFGDEEGDTDTGNDVGGGEDLGIDAELDTDETDTEDTTPETTDDALQEAIKRKQIKLENNKNKLLKEQLQKTTKYQKSYFNSLMEYYSPKLDESDEIITKIKEREERSLNEINKLIEQIDNKKTSI